MKSFVLLFAILITSSSYAGTMLPGLQAFSKTRENA